MNIQTKVSEIHHQFGVTEMANYKIELLFNDLLKQEKAKWERQVWSGSEDESSEVAKMVVKFIDENLPDYDKAFHHEAEIASGLHHFMQWVSAQKQIKNPEKG